MTPNDFCYWLQGYFELQETPDQGITPRQVEVIKEHLSLVLKKVTPIDLLSPPRCPTGGGKLC